MGKQKDPSGMQDETIMHEYCGDTYDRYKHVSIADILTSIDEYALNRAALLKKMPDDPREYQAEWHKIHLLCRVIEHKGLGGEPFFGTDAKKRV